MLQILTGNQVEDDMETGCILVPIGIECRKLHNSTRALKQNMLQVRQSCEGRTSKICNLLHSLKEVVCFQNRGPSCGS